MLQRDFAKGEGYLAEYEELCNIDLNGLLGAERTAAMTEMRKRRANFLCLVGKGREGQQRETHRDEAHARGGHDPRVHPVGDEALEGANGNRRVDRRSQQKV